MAGVSEEVDWRRFAQADQAIYVLQKFGVQGALIEHLLKGNGAVAVFNARGEERRDQARACPGSDAACQFGTCPEKCWTAWQKRRAGFSQCVHRRFDARRVRQVLHARG